MTAGDAGPGFWETKTLHEMSREEWESLCDGCGKCCLLKLQDDETEQLHYTRVICRYFQESSCSCSVYQKRKKLVPTCLELHPDELEGLDWMPSTCAYRLLHDGKPLPVWHPLIAGNRSAMQQSGNCVKGRVVSEDYVHEDGLEEHIVHWVD